MSTNYADNADRQGVADGVSTATLREVDILAELDRRPCRLRNHARHDRAFAQLATEMADNPRNMLQKLVEIAVDLCEADTAGISLLEGDVFRWEAVAGVFAAARGGTMPRAASPCGVCIDRNATQLMHLADRYFPALLNEPRFVEALLVPFHDHGQPIGTVWVVSHSATKKFDRDDERIVRTLSQFAAAGWQLLKTSEAATAASHRKDDFLATLGHELRNPLAAIAAAGSNLRVRMAAIGGSTAALDVISRQSQQMFHIVDALLDVARIGSGKLQLTKTRVDLRSVVEDAAQARRVQLDRHRHRLEVMVGDSPVMADLDAVRVAQMVSNLLDNATKYTPDGGSITVVLTRTATEVAIAVHDTGIGIAPAQLTSIFGRFTQLSEPGRERTRGLGLGLALVRSLAELHGGTIVAESAGIGEGSCFTIRLPLAL